MMFLSTLLIVWVVSVTASPLVWKRTETPEGFQGLPKHQCPSGQSVFVASTPGKVPTATPAQVWGYIGNFCDPSWQDVVLINTTGSCNVPGNVRFFSVLGETLQERLDANQVPSGRQGSPQVYGQAFTLVGTYVFANTTITNVHDVLSVSPRKGGVGTDINWVVGGCSTDPAFSQAVFTQQHGQSVGNAETHSYA